MNGYLAAMRQFASPKQRASRSEFWWFYAVYLVIFLIAAGLDGALGTTTRSGGVLMGLVQLVHLVPQISVSVRRMHDSDHSGWWLLLPPVFLVFAFFGGTPGPNRFGPSPVGASPAAPSGLAAPAAPPQAAPQAPRDPIAEVERLARLRDSGSLTEVEFDVMKAQALSQPRTP